MPFMTYGPAERLHQALLLVGQVAPHKPLPLKTRTAVAAALQDVERAIAQRSAYAAEIAEARTRCNDECEIDDYPVLSESDAGVWVSAWLWVAIDPEKER